jgi:hypothetical protein
MEYNILYCRQKNMPHRVKLRKADRIGHIFRMNCLPMYFVEGKIYDMERRGKGYTQPLDDV